MNKLLAVVFIYTLCIGLGVLVMIYGWGLEVKSWWWVIGGGVGIRMLIEVMSFASKRDKGG